MRNAIRVCHRQNNMTDIISVRFNSYDNRPRSTDHYIKVVYICELQCIIYLSILVRKEIL